MTETLTSLSDQRDKVVAETQEWLGRTAHLMNTLLLPRFPAAREISDWSWRPDTLQFATPFIVLPAQEVRSFNDTSDKDMIRRVAIRLRCSFDSTAGIGAAIKQRIESGGTIPTPAEVCIMDPHPLALPADKASGAELSPYSRSISGDRLDLLRWAAFGAPGGGIPQDILYGGEDEATKFSIFRDYPPEALARKPKAVEYHRRQLERFQDSIAVISIALQDDELNPRS